MRVDDVKLSNYVEDERSRRHARAHAEYLQQHPLAVQRQVPQAEPEEERAEYLGLVSDGGGEDQVAKQQSTENAGRDGDAEAEVLVVLLPVVVVSSVLSCNGWQPKGRGHREQGGRVVVAGGLGEGVECVSRGKEGGGYITIHP